MCYLLKDKYNGNDDMKWIQININKGLNSKRIYVVNVFIASVLFFLNMSVVVYAQRPNVLLILTDDQGYSDVGFNGNPIVKTTVLDRFTSSAAVFDHRN